jgi:HPr kinase/phosphorylase
MLNLSLHILVDTLASPINLSWVCGEDFTDRMVRLVADNAAALCHTVGYLSLIHPPQIQIIGRYEIAYLSSLSPQVYINNLEQLFNIKHIACIIFADDCEITEGMQELAKTYQVPLFTTTHPAQKVMNHLHVILQRLSLTPLTLHGVFMDVLGMGILIRGDSGIGKSELALELISRGHRLIADDAPEFRRIAPTIIEGTCPLDMTPFLEVRGLGVLNVQRLFGDSAVKKSKYLRLIINLHPTHSSRLKDLDRLNGECSLYNVLGVDIPEITLPVAPGRNLAVLIECAVRHHSLKQQGYDAVEDFSSRQQQAILACNLDELE